MAKQSIAFSWKGMWSLETGYIVESGKEEDKVYDLMKVLQEWNGQNISVAIKLEGEPEQVTEESVSEDYEDGDSDW